MFFSHRRILSLPVSPGSLSFQSSRKGTPTYSLFPHLFIVAHQRVAFAYEAGPTGYGLYDGLVAQEFRCLIASPSMIPKAPGQRVKTNRLDSVGLTENLRGGQLKGIHVPSPLYRELRHLTQLRDTFVNGMA